jgi:uncharacterized membrane protein
MKKQRSAREGTGRDPQRMEAFADAVLAIGITLPIVEVELPKPGPDGDLVRPLLEAWPSYAAYLMSFLTIGVYWLRHHFVGKIYRRADHNTSLSTLLFLMTVCFLPFPTRVLLEHIKEPQQREAAALFYLASLLLASCAWMVKWLVGRHTGALEPSLEPAYLAYATRLYALTTAGFAVALLLWFVNVWLALGLALGMILFYLLPPKAPVFVDGRE